MRDVLFELGPVKIRSFGVMIVLGFFAALWLVRRRARAFGFDPNKVADLCLAVLFAGVIGARVVFILQELPTYIANPRSLLTLEFAGLTSFGGLLFAAGAVAIWAKRHNASFLKIGDLLAPPYLLAYAIGRVGCLLNGCCYGGACPTDLPWGVQFRGTQGPHHPAQIYEAIMSIAGLLIMLRFEKRLAPGQGIGLFFVVHGLARFIYEFWRAGTRLQVERGEATSTYWEALHPVPLTEAHVVAGAMIILGAVLLVFFGRRAAAQQELLAA